MADSLLFRKGTLAELANAGIVNGSINITTDEPGIYVDFDGERKRVGDFQMFDTLDDAAKAARQQNLSKTALYYTVEGNYLLRWDGSNFTWINDVSDLRTSLQTLQGSITGINNNIKAIIGNGDNGSVDGTDVKSLKALTDAMKNVASDSTVADLQASVAANAKAIQDNKTAIATTNGIVNGINTTIGSSDDTATAETIYGKIAANKAQLGTQSSAIQANTQAIIEGDNAVKAIIGTGYSSSNTVSSAITALSTKVDTNTASINTHTTKIENLEKAIGAGGSVETQINEAITELNLPSTYKTIADAKTDHDAINAEIDTLKTTTSTNAGAISNLSAKVDVAKVSTAITNAVSPVSGRVDTLESDNTTNKSNISTNAAAISTNADAIATNSGKIANNTSAIQAEKERMDAFLAAADVGDAAIDTLKEIQNYIVSDGQAAATMTSNIAANAKAIDDLEDTMVAADNAIKTRLAALEDNTITEKGDTNLVIATDTNGNTTISFQWGSF